MALLVGGAAAIVSPITVSWATNRDRKKKNMTATDATRLYALFSIVQQVFSPKGVPRIFDALLTRFGTFLFSQGKTRLILAYFCHISDAFLTHSCCCPRLFREHVLDDTDFFSTRKQGNFLHIWGHFPENKKAYTTTTERKSFGELLCPQRKPFQAGGGYKNPMKTRKTISTTEIFPLWPPLCRQREVLHWSRAVHAFFFPAMTATDATGFYAFFLRPEIGQFSPHLGSFPYFEARKGIPKNLSCQVLGEVQVNFWCEFLLLKPFIFVNRRSELFRKLLGRLRMSLCYWKTFPVHFLTKLHSEPGEKGKNPLGKIQRIQWRRRPEISDLCPLSLSKVSWTKWRCDFQEQGAKGKKHIAQKGLHIQLLPFGSSNRLLPCHHKRIQLFCLQLEASCLQWSFFAYNWQF